MSKIYTIKQITTKNTPKERWGSTLSYCSNQFILYGGSFKQNYFNDVNYLNKHDNKWNTLHYNLDIMSRSNHVELTINNNYIIYHGGRFKKTKYSDLLWFSVNDYTFSYFNEINPENKPKARSDHACSFLYDKSLILFFGGDTEGTIDNNCYILNISDEYTANGSCCWIKCKLYGSYSPEPRKFHTLTYHKYFKI